MKFAQGHLRHSLSCKSTQLACDSLACERRSILRASYGCLAFEPWHEISNNVVCGTSKASDQDAHTRSLIRAFASHLNILGVLHYWPNSIWGFLNLKGGCTDSSESTLVKMPHCWKSHVTAHLVKIHEVCNFVCNLLHDLTPAENCTNKGSMMCNRLNRMIAVSFDWRKMLDNISPMITIDRPQPK